MFHHLCQPPCSKYDANQAFYANTVLCEQTTTSPREQWVSGASCMSDALSILCERCSEHPVVQRNRPTNGCTPEVLSGATPLITAQCPGMYHKYNKFKEPSLLLCGPYKVLIQCKHPNHDKLCHQPHILMERLISSHKHADQILVCRK